MLNTTGSISYPGGHPHTRKPANFVLTNSLAPPPPLTKNINRPHLPQPHSTHLPFPTNTLELFNWFFMIINNVLKRNKIWTLNHIYRHVTRAEVLQLP